MSDPVKPKPNAHVSTTTLDIDINNILNISVDPRNQMAERLLFRGHATVDEIMGVSFGTWPPKGIDLIGSNSQRVDFVSLSQMFNTTDPGILLEKGRDALGFAASGNNRHIWISDKLRGEAAGAQMLGGILGHEGAHILQFDHQVRAPSVFGHEIGNRLRDNFSKPISNLLADSVFGRHTDEARLQAANKPFEGKPYGMGYYKDGVEIQARIHEIMVEGYPKWKQLPQNREQFLVAMQSAGVQLSPTTKAELERSPNYADAKKLFGEPAPTRAANEINIARSTLTDIGQPAFEKDTLTRMYADLIEMYGDRPGRERFGYGVNEYALAREARANINPNKVMDVPDFQNEVFGSQGVFITKKGTDAATYARTKEAFKAGGINFSDTVSGIHGEGMYVGQEEFIKIADIRDAARKPAPIKMPEADLTSATPERVIAQSKLVETNKGRSYIPIGTTPEADRQLLMGRLDSEGIKYKQTQPALLGGMLSIEIDAKDTVKYKAIKAEVELARPVMFDPKTPEYHLQMARANFQREVHDYSRAASPVAPTPIQPPVDGRTLLAQSEIFNTVGKGDYVSVQNRSELEKKALTDALDKAGIRYAEKTSSVGGGTKVLAIEQADTTKFRTLHAEVMAPPINGRQLLAKSEVLETVGKGDYVSVQNRSDAEKRALTDALDKAGIRYTEKTSSVDGGKKVLAIDQADTAKFRTLHAEVTAPPINGRQLLAKSEVLETVGKGDYVSVQNRSDAEKRALTDALDKAGIRYTEKTSSVDGGKKVLAIDQSQTNDFRKLHAEVLKAPVEVLARAPAQSGVSAFAPPEAPGTRTPSAPAVPDAPVIKPPAAAAAGVAAVAAVETNRLSAGVASATPAIGSGVGIAMGVYGLSQKLGENGTAAKDLKDERTATLAKVGIAADVTAIAADSTELLARASRGMAAASKVGRVAAPVGMALSVASGAIDYKIAERQGDGKRAAAAIGGTTGGIIAGMAGAAASAKVGAAAGAAVGLLFGGVGAGPGALIGGAIFGVAGALGFGWAGAEAGKKVAEATIEKPLQRKFDEDKKAEMATAKPAKPSTPTATPAPKTQVAANEPSYHESSSKYARRLDPPSTEKFAASAPALGKEFARVSSETAVAAPKPAMNDPVYKVAAGAKVSVLPSV